LEDNVHVYKKGNEGVWTVGFYEPDLVPGKYRWYPVKNFADEETAAVYVNFLNGGKGEFPKADLRGT
jgi:hypothetical protein